MGAVIIILFGENAGGGTWGDRGTEGSVTVSHCVITGAKGNCKRFSVIILLKVLSEDFCSDVKGGADGGGITRLLELGLIIGVGLLLLGLRWACNLSILVKLSNCLLILGFFFKINKASFMATLYRFSALARTCVLSTNSSLVGFFLCLVL